MAEDIKHALIAALEKPNSEEGLANELVSLLLMDKRVMDAAESEGDTKKSAGGFRKEEEYQAEDPSKCWKHGYAHRAMEAEKEAKVRREGMLNPQPTSEKERKFTLSGELDRALTAIKDTPDSKAETSGMERDMENLRKEAGMKKLDEGFPPYAEYVKRWGEYGEEKDLAMQKWEQTKQMLAGKKYDEVEKMLGMLRQQPKEIADKYRQIQEAYERCCEGLCEQIDQKGTDHTEAYEAEKKEFGMLRGESSSAYQKRMEANGKGKEVPETIKRIDGIVAQTERRWRSVLGMGEDEFEAVKENFRKTIATMMKGCSLASNLGIMGLNGVLEGHLKSQHDMVKKGERYSDGNASHNFIIGGNMQMPRYRFTRKCFGTDESLSEGEYEKYGCMHASMPSEEDNLIGGQYGKNVVRWKPYKVVATMTFTDSLCLARDSLNFVNPCLVTDPSPCCFNPMNKQVVEMLKKGPMNMGLRTMCMKMGTPYCELQLHGGDQYNADAIESISFGRAEDVANLSPKARETIRENNIDLYLGGRPIKIGEDGGIEEVEAEE